MKDKFMMVSQNSGEIFPLNNVIYLPISVLKEILKEIKIFFIILIFENFLCFRNK